MNDWKTQVQESLAAIEAEIEKLAAAREALRAVIGTEPPIVTAPAAARQTQGKPSPPRERPARSAGNALSRILQYFALRPGSQIRAEVIASDLGIGLSTARNNMGRRRDLFQQPGHGLWALTEAGKVAASGSSNGTD